MTRKEFIKICALLGISIPFQPVLASHQPVNTKLTTPFKGKVLIIGAGAAGLTAGHLLKQQGVDFQILEASSTYGGRMKTTKGFVDFPIPLGAEWLHVKRNVFDEIVNNPSVKVATQTKLYDQKADYGLYKGHEVSIKSLGFNLDQKFINSSWLDFFEQYILPSVKDKIKCNEIVESIDYTGEKGVIKTKNGDFIADKIILTVPVKTLQSNAISFAPPLPKHKSNAIENVTVWDGFKVFIEFSEKFYPAVVNFKIKPRAAGQKLYYDAAYGQRSNRHVLGLFTVGSGTLPYRQLSNDELISYMLKELDEIFDGKASSSYINHISQNWNDEPFIEGAYVNDHEKWKRVRALGEPVGDKLFFAGTSYTDGEDWGSVHNAAQSAISVVNKILTQVTHASTK